MIKAVLLLITLSCCWQSSALDMEQVKEERRGIKRSAQQAEVFEREKEDSFKVFSNDIVRYILQYFDLAKDQNTLLPLSASCKRFNGIIQRRYSDANKAERHYPWKENPSLNQSTVYTLNTRLRTILGFYNNIKKIFSFCNIGLKCDNITENIDQIRFENLCSQFVKKNHLFSENFMPVMYVKVLQLHLNWSKLILLPNSSTNRLPQELNEKKLILEQKLRSIASQKNLKLQNEIALCFHYQLFVFKAPYPRWVNLHNTSLFRKLDGSLMRVMDQELLSLKATPGLSRYAGSSETWKRIIDLEPAVTAFQLDSAAHSYLDAARLATDPQVKIANFTKCAEYFEELLKAIKIAGKNPTVTDYYHLALTYSRIGENATDPQVKFANFTKSAEYSEEEFKAIKIAGKNPTATEYDNIAYAYLCVGENATDPQVKFANFTKSIGYSEEEFKAIRIAGKNPTATEYDNIAYAYLCVGENATDPQVKFANYTRAKAYFEIALKGKGSDWNYSLHVVKRLILVSTYLGDLKKAAHHENFDKKN